MMLIVSSEPATRPVPLTLIDDTTPPRSLLSRGFSAQTVNRTSSLLKENTSVLDGLFGKVYGLFTFAVNAIDTWSTIANWETIDRYL